MMSDAQTAYALAIVFELVPTEQHQALGDRLADLVREYGYRIGTGFVGTPIVNDALTRTGHADVRPGCSPRPSARRGCTR